MKTKALLLFTTSIFFLLSIQAQEWEIFYQNNTINVGINTQHQIHSWTEGNLLLLEKDYSGINENQKHLRIKRYEISQWNGNNQTTEGWELVGQVLNLNQANNEGHVDFVVSPEGSLYIGMKDTIFTYNSAENLWIPTYLPNYIGGLTSDEAGNIYFLETTDANPHYFTISKLTSQGAQAVASINYELPFGVTLYPRIVNQANKIIINNDMFIVSIARASTNQNYYFKGNATEGFSMLPEHFTHLNLSSMLLRSNGELIIAYRDGQNPYHLKIKKFDDVTNDWIDFEMNGLTIGESSFNHLKEGPDGSIYLSYHGPLNQGYLFKYSENSWELIGNPENPTHTVGPFLTFDSNNRIYLSHGNGSIGSPLIVMRLANPTSLTEKSNQDLFIVYPNPAKDILFIKQLKQNYSFKQIIIRDLTGKEIHSENFSGNMHQGMLLSQLNSGVYIMEIVTLEKGTRFQQKFIIQ